MTATLSIADLHVRQGAFTLGPVSFDLGPGDYVVLMGPSGCGKTTLLKAIAGFLVPDSGEIRLAGQRLNRVPPEQRRIGYVSQHALLFPHLSVQDNIAFGLAYQALTPGERSARCIRMATLVGVAHLLDRMPHTLSGGEGRRVALARALATDPAVLLLDEPLSMLDAPARRELVDVLRQVQARTGTPTLHVTHHDEEARQVGGRCIRMKDGQLA